MIDFEKMKEKALRFGVSLDANQLRLLDHYAEMLVDWNTRMNLTGITDSEGIMTRHFEDSLALLGFADVPEGAKVIDVGTGAGFPGMVLKIARPDIQLTLLDSLNKRILFLTEVAKELSLNVQPVHSRAEEGGRRTEFRGQFDIACARAVSQLRELAEYCIPFVKPGGCFISMKGPDIVEELNAARAAIGTLGGKIRITQEYTISDESGRTLILVDKVKATPLQFPRSSAKIAKKPL